MIGIAHAKDRKCRGADGIARSPGESERAAFSVVISGRPVRHQLAVRAFESVSLGAVGNNFYIAEKVRIWISTRCVVRGELVIAGEVEEQPGFGCARKA